MSRGASRLAATVPPARIVDPNAPSQAAPVFESFRQALQDVLRRGTAPEDRRTLLSHMRDTLAQARVGLDDLRSSIATTRARLAAEQKELETVRRRLSMAEAIGDQETVRVAQRFERQHAERAEVLARKLAAQESELAMTEDEVREMTEAYKGAAKGIGPAGSAPGGRTLEEQAAADLERELNPEQQELSELNALRREQEKAAREQEAARRLEELKRRMGK